MTRQIPKDIGDYPFDLIVVGAGINGAGIARDAAMRGLKVLLLDKGDISDGTTQWSTRLIHGGLRYLEYYEGHLVRESLAEREKLLKIAPHLVKPLRFVVPIYERSKRGPGMIRLGMIGYDALSFDKSVPNHRMLSREEGLEQYPGLNPDGLLGAATYYDGQVEYAERIAVENAVSAHERGATVLTYAEVKRLLYEESGNGGLPRASGVEFEDRLGGGTYAAHAPVTVNVAGPWVDRVLSGAGSFGVDDAPEGADGEREQMIGGTKGSHIVVDPFPGAPGDALYVEARRDGRPYFIVPWNGRYLIGTTDFRYREDLDYVSADDDEIDYLVDETNAVVPSANLSREDVLFTYSGVRPLPFKPEGSESSITRAHVVYDHATGGSAAGGRLTVEGAGPKADGLVSIVGGKLTTYRNLARQTVNVAFKKLGREAPKSRTDKVPLPGGAVADFAAFSADFKATSGLTEELSERLLRLYGARAPEVLLGGRMVGLAPKGGLEVDEAAAAVAAKYLGWTEEQADREGEGFRKYVERYRPKDFREKEPAGA